MTSFPAAPMKQDQTHLASDRKVEDRRPRVVIVGAGFGGLTAARNLAKASVDLTLIDRENHHLFQPLLYQVATAGLSPADIAWPIRRLVRRQKNTRVLLGEVTGVDRARKCVILGDREIGYDILVLATGAAHGHFGNDNWAAYAPGLKAIDDATEIRRRLLLAFERAEMERGTKSHLLFAAARLDTPDCDCCLRHRRRKANCGVCHSLAVPDGLSVTGKQRLDQRAFRQRSVGALRDHVLEHPLHAF